MLAGLQLILKVNNGMNRLICWKCITHFIPLVSIYTPWKHLVFWCFRGYENLPTAWKGLLQWKRFKNDRRGFLLHLKSSSLRYLDFSPDFVGNAGKQMMRKLSKNYDVVSWETNNHDSYNCSISQEVKTIREYIVVS